MYVLSGAKGSVGIDNVFAKEAEDVIVDFGWEVIPVRHEPLSLKDSSVSRSFPNLINQTFGFYPSSATLGDGYNIVYYSMDGHFHHVATASLGLLTSRCGLIAPKTNAPKE